MQTSKFKDLLRTLFRIRQPRALPPAGPKPAFGTSIVKDNLKMQLFMAIDYEQWEFLTEQGWRAMDYKNNRRRYYSVPRKAVERLLRATPEKRIEIHQRILDTRYPARYLY
jgi:hypothetical protein